MFGLFPLPLILLFPSLKSAASFQQETEALLPLAAAEHLLNPKPLVTRELAHRVPFQPTPMRFRLVHCIIQSGSLLSDWLRAVLLSLS